MIRKILGIVCFSIVAIMMISLIIGAAGIKGGLVIISFFVLLITLVITGIKLIEDEM